MMPHYSGVECAQLHMCFLRDIAAECRKVRRDMYVFYTPEGKPDVLFPVFGAGARYRCQHGDTLGERMYQAFHTVLGEGYESCVLIGTDVPEVTAGYLEDAFDKLRNQDVVLGPTKDGGYYLIGMKRAFKAAFEKQTYGHETVFANTIEMLKDHGLSVGRTGMLADMDRPEDLRGLLERCRCGQNRRARYTRTFLESHRKVSIIIPVYNEAGTIPGMIRQLWSLRKDCEIIFVDGGSSDGTAEKISKYFPVIRTRKGRAFQMNAGAKTSSGDILFFLHCDSKLPADPLGQIEKVMKRYRVGGFGVAFASKHFFMFTCRLLSNFRMKMRGIIFGDQGMFIERNLFFEMGMFPPQPFMEDYQFALNLKKAGEPIGMTRNRIYTSDRRYPKRTVAKLRLMWQMYDLRKRYRQGAPLEKLAKAYRDIR